MTNPLFDNTSPVETPAEVDAETAKALLIGEGKKYKTETDGIKALYHAQQHIARLEQENREAKAALTERKNGEDLLALLEQKLKTTNVQTPPEPNNVVPPVNDNNKAPSLTREEIASLLDERLNVNKRMTTEEQNLSSVIKTLEDNWGPGFKQDLKSRASALGVSEDYLLSLAKSSPQVFLNAVGGNSKKGSPTDGLPPRTSQGIPARTNDNTRNKSFYDKMRREDPKRYHSMANQAQMHNDAIALKEKFFS